MSNQIPIYTKDDFQAITEAGQLAAKALDLVAPLINPGVSTDVLDKAVLEFALDHGAAPAPLFYRGFPKAICTSINHVVCHGIPSSKPLKNGDIINVDITLIKDGWHGDSSRMYGVGDIPRKAERLIEITYEALQRGIDVVKPGATTGDIGHAIQSFVEENRYSVVRDFCGHGIGKSFHHPPNILHYGRSGDGYTLKEGMIFTIEPMVNLGKAGVKVLSDGWTAVTRDRSLSAQFEHTIGVTKDGVQIFTLSPDGLDYPLAKS